MGARRLCRFLICLCLAGLALQAPAELRAETPVATTRQISDAFESDARSTLPTISTEPAPVPPALLELLPPGARRPVRGVSERRGPDGIRAVERIASPLFIGDAPRWLEIEYTIDIELDDRVRGILERAGLSLGHVILMDPRTGEVFSYVSTNPEIFPLLVPIRPLH